MKTERFIQVASTFVCTPAETSLRSSLAEEGFAAELSFFQFTQMSEYMLAAPPNCPGMLGIVVILRLEDWFREHLNSGAESTSDAAIRQAVRPRIEEFVSQLGILSRLGKQVWFLPCPSTGWVSERNKLGGLFRTFTNLVVARVRNIPSVLVLNWPVALSAGVFDDMDADGSAQTPFTPDAFQRLGDWMGHQIAVTLAGKNSTASQAPSGKSSELAAYLARLDVRVQIIRAGPSERTDVERLLRTVASFSLTGENPTICEAEVDGVLGSQGCYLITVQDRTSDYGKSGVIAFETLRNDLIIGSMALSCTVLGKQVECAVLSAVASLATGLNCKRIIFRFRSNGRNQSMLAFLQQAATQESDNRFVLPVVGIETRIEELAVNPGAWTLTIPDQLAPTLATFSP